MGLPVPLWSTVKIYDFGNGAQMIAVRKSERNANDERVTANHSERELKTKHEVRGRRPRSGAAGALMEHRQNL